MRAFSLLAPRRRPAVQSPKQAVAIAAATGERPLLTATVEVPGELLDDLSLCIACGPGG